MLEGLASLRRAVGGVLKNKEKESIKPAWEQAYASQNQLARRNGNDESASVSSVASSAGALARSTRSHTGSLHDADPEEVAELQELISKGLSLPDALSFQRMNRMIAKNKKQ